MRPLVNFVRQQIHLGLEKIRTAASKKHIYFQLSCPSISGVTRDLDLYFLHKPGGGRGALASLAFGEA